MALSKVDLENQVENILPETLGGTGASQFPAQFRNIIINGDMSIAQRGTSTASITSSGYYTVDRWQTGISLGTWTQSQDTDVPSGQGFAKSLKMDCTTANASPSAGNSLVLATSFEGQMLQYLKKGTANAESLTLSFWVKSNKTGTYIAEFYDNDNNRSISKSYTISSANTWEKKTITYAGDTTGVFGNDNNLSLVLQFWLGAGSNYTSGTLQTSWGSTVASNRAVGQVNLADSTANEWYITGVQLEAGTTASDFEFLPYDVNKNRCFRYYQSYKDGGETRILVGQARYGDTVGAWSEKFTYHTELRTSPTLSYDDNNGNSLRMAVQRLDSTNTNTTNLNLRPFNARNTIHGFDLNSYNENTGLLNYGDIGIAKFYNLTADAEL